MIEHRVIERMLALLDREHTKIIKDRKVDSMFIDFAIDPKRLLMLTVYGECFNVCLLLLPYNCISCKYKARLLLLSLLTLIIAEQNTLSNVIKSTTYPYHSLPLKKTK
jgi:hypothetical protein